MSFSDTGKGFGGVVTASNGVSYSAGQATPWGSSGCPIIPVAYRRMYGHEEAPTLLKKEARDSALTLGDLGVGVWGRLSMQVLRKSHRQVIGTEIARLQIPAGAVAIPAGLPMRWVADLPIRIRTRNAINRFVKEHGEGPLGHTLPAEDVMEWRAVGKATLIDLLCVIESAELDSRGLQTVDTGEHSAMRKSSSEGYDHLRDVAAWALSETSATTIGDALGCLVGRAIAVDEWRQLAEFRLLALSDHPVHPYRAVQAWADRLPERERSIFISRFRVGDGRPTLEEVGKRLKLTRERIRQLEHLLLVELSEYMETRPGRTIKWRVDTIRRRGGVAFPLDEVRDLLAPPGPQPDYSFLFKLLAGPYVEDKDWLVLKSALDDDPSATILESTDRFGCIVMEEAREALSVWGLDNGLHVRWLSRGGRCRLIDGRLVRWKGPLGDKLALALDRIGSPATVEEIKDNLGLDQSLGSIQNGLREDTRFIRSGMTAWGLAWWGLAEYEGISSTIHRLLQTKGTMPVSEVVEWMMRNFGSREGSVRSFCTAPAFVIEEGSIRLRRADEPYAFPPTPLAEAKGAFALGPGRAGLLFKVTADTLRGSGRPVGTVIGSLLGIAPDQDLAFRSSSGETVRVTFPATTNSGPSLGSVRSLCVTAGAEIGDFLNLVFDRSSLTLVATVTDVGSHGTGWGLVSRLTGINEKSGLQGLAAAVGSEPGEVRSVLRQRGDHVVADALPHSPGSSGGDNRP